MMTISPVFAAILAEHLRRERIDRITWELQRTAYPSRRRKRRWWHRG